MGLRRHQSSYSFTDFLRQSPHWRPNDTASLLIAGGSLPDPKSASGILSGEICTRVQTSPHARMSPQGRVDETGCNFPIHFLSELDRPRPIKLYPPKPCSSDLGMLTFAARYSNALVDAWTVEHSSSASAAPVSRVGVPPWRMMSIVAPVAPRPARMRRDMISMASMLPSRLARSHAKCFGHQDSSQRREQSQLLSNSFFFVKSLNLHLILPAL